MGRWARCYILSEDPNDGHDGHIGFTLHINRCYLSGTGHTAPVGAGEVSGSPLVITGRLTADEQVLIRVHRCWLNNTLHSVQSDIILSRQNRAISRTRSLTGKQPRASGGRSAILTGLSVFFGGTGFVGGMMTSSNVLHMSISRNSARCATHIVYYSLSPFRQCKLTPMRKSL